MTDKLPARPELPELPEPEATIPDFGDVFQASYMRDYGQQCADEREVWARADERRKALREAAAAVEDHNRAGRAWVLGSLWDTLSREAATRIRDLIPKP